MSLIAFKPQEIETLANPGLEETFERIGGAKIHVSVHTPNEITPDTKRFLIDDGYQSRETDYIRFGQELARLGHIAVTHGPADGQDLRKRLALEHWDGMKLASQAINASRKATNQILDLDPTSKYIIAGHSLGGYVSFLYAKHNPETVEAMIPIASAGMGKHTVPEMLQRTSEVMQIHLIDLLGQLGADAMQGCPSLTSHMLGTFGSLSKLDRRIREGYAAATCDTTPLIYLARQAGIPVDIIAFNNDPYSNIKENTNAANKTNSRLHIVRGTHFTPQSEPLRLAQEIDCIVQPNLALAA
jgi:pimeloyl-ACP methyl ester carboxylesterase